MKILNTMKCLLGAAVGVAVSTTLLPGAVARYVVFQDIHLRQGTKGYEFNIPPSKLQAMPQVMVFDLVKKPDEQAGVTNVHADWGPFTAPTSRKLRVALHLHHFFGTAEEEIEVLISGKTVWHITDDASITPPPSEVRPLLGGATDDGT
jgi:hypothetical protein